VHSKGVIILLMWWQCTISSICNNW